MAAGDKFLFEVARQGIHSGLVSPADIGYRQRVLADCIAQPGVIRDLYDVAVAAITAETAGPRLDLPGLAGHPRAPVPPGACGSTWTCSAG